MSWAALVIQGIMVMVGGTAAGAAVVAWANRDKTSAEAEQIAASRRQLEAQTDGTIVDTTQRLVQSVTQEMIRVREELHNLETRFDAVEAEKADLARRFNAQDLKITAMRRVIHAYRERVDYLTDRIVTAAIEVSDWTPPPEA